MQRDVLVVAEHWAGEVETITYQMLAKGRELADGLGGQLAGPECRTAYRGHIPGILCKGDSIL